MNETNGLQVHSYGISPLQGVILVLILTAAVAAAFTVFIMQSMV